MKFLKKIFHRYQQNAVKKYISGTSRMRWKKIFAPLPAECGEKKFSPLKLQILQIFTANFNGYLKMTGIISKVSHRWRSGIRSCWHAWDKRFQPVYGGLFFVNNPLNAVQKIFSQIKTANLTKIHRIER